MNSKRIRRVRNLFIDQEIDALFCSNYYNILYLTGFKTLTTDEREAFVLVTKEHVFLFTDARYIITNPDVILKLIEPGKGLFYHLQSIIKDEHIRSIGIESEDLRVHEYLKLQTLFESTSVVPTERLLIELRAKKEKEEVSSIRMACEIGDRCLKDIISTIRIGDTEQEIAFRIEQWIRKNEYDLGFDPIIAINAHSAIPHYHTKEGNGSVTNESVILMDFGVKYKDYRSDITRMVFIKPSDEMLRVYSELCSIQEETIRSISLNIPAKEIDTFCREQLKGKGLPNFSHSIGHGVGLEIHEYPKLSQASTDMVQNDQVFTVEPGIYFSGKWGMRIEDTIMMESGRVDILTKFDKKPVILSG